jgi:predicted transglutaminase-like cysteine proteinase
MPISSRARRPARIFTFAVILATVSLAIGDAAARAKAKNQTRSADSIEVSAASQALSTPPTMPAQARFFTINQVLAKFDGRTVSSDSIRLASIEPGNTITDAPVARTPLPERSNGPFGLFEFRAPEGLLWVKWRRVEEDMRAEAKVVAQCRVEPDHCASPAAVRFLSIVAIARGLEDRARLQAVNREVNSSIRYMSDLAQHSVPDLWSAPLATFTTGFGDCEDYAVAKYAILREAGIAADDLRILLVRDRTIRQDHAVLAARHENRWLILDNRHLALTEDTELGHFMPLFAIDHEGVKLFAAPYAMRPANDNATAVAPAATLERDATTAPLDAYGTPFLI